VKLIKKLQENMRGFYPALCRVLLSCVGPHHHPSGQPNNTAFNIFKDAMYVELQKLPLLAQSNPDKLGDFLPDHVTYDPGNKALTHVYRDGTQVMTHLGQLALGSVSLTDPLPGRPLTADERSAAERAFL
jgi:hypothetical protein